MKQLEPLGFFLAGAIVGAACMHYSRNKAMIAADRERSRAEKAMNELNEIRIEQANSAGYADGYHAGLREMEADQEIGIVNGVFAQSLRDGKKVTWTVLDR